MIYLDNAATTPPDSAALAQAQSVAEQHFYNPSARYRGGDESLKALNAARAELLGLIADPMRHELVFTSGGTEADNQAVFSAARRGEVLVTKGEHAAVWESVKELKNLGCEVVVCPLRADGSIDAEALADRVTDKTTLVCAMHVNNETGAVNDIVSIAKAVKRKNPRCLFFSDGVQGFGKIPVYLTGDIDYYAVSAHKIGGVRGTGALYRKKGSPLAPRLFGGGQEGGMRSGTENLFAAVNFSCAARIKFATLQEDFQRLGRYRQLLFEGLDREKFVFLSPEQGSPYIFTVANRKMRGEIAQRILYDRGFAVGTGSACNSKKPYSRVIEACGVEKSLLSGVLRLSFCPQTTQEEIAACIGALNAL